MEPDTATQILRDEHQLILRVVGVFEDAIDSLVEGRTSGMEEISQCITFFRLFADACHHGKEEDVLFPELIETGMSREAGPIAVMLAEHRRGREFVRRMAESLEPARAGDTDAAFELARAGRDYIDLIRQHIAKEDGILFVMADGLVSGARCERLCGAYREADQCRFEERTKAQLETLADRITGDRTGPAT